jgi:calcium-activated chloride channel regulator 4
VRSEADNNLELLAQVSGGKVYFIPDGTGLDDLNDALSGSLTYQPEVPTADKEIIVAKNSKAPAPSGTKGDFAIDQSLGKSVNLRVSVAPSNNNDRER